MCVSNRLINLLGLKGFAAKASQTLGADLACLGRLFFRLDVIWSKNLLMSDLFKSATTEVANRSEAIKFANSWDGDSALFFYSTFNKAAKSARESNDIPLAEVYELLSQTFSMMFQTGKPSDPFGPLASFATGRSAIPSDFTSENLEVLEHFVDKASCAPFNARIADVLWLRKRDPMFAKSAISSYLEHAAGHIRNEDERHEFLQAIDALERAAQLCAQIGSPTEIQEKIVSVAEASVSLVEPEPENYFRILVIKVIAKYGLCSDHAAWSDGCDNLAKQSEATNHHDKARSYWKCALQFSEFAEDRSRIEAFTKRRSDSFVVEARAMNKAGVSGMIVADLYSKAIEACRRIGGRRDLIDQLHLEMNDAQQRALGELKKISVPWDCTALIEAASEAIERAASIKEKLDVVATMANPPRKQDLRTKTEKQANEFVFLNAVTAVSYNDQGRVVARTDPIIGSEQDDKEAAILAQMILLCSQDQRLASATQIEIARASLDKKIATADAFADLVEVNPFVPPGREAIFVEGLMAGLRGEHLNCAHLLIPQIENSVREYMQSAGHLTTRLTSQFTQKEFDLNKLLYDPKCEAIFGADLVFSLRCLLVEELGGNFRNKLAHGLLAADDFHSGWVNYLWALTIRLCVVGKLLAERRSAADVSGSKDQIVSE